MMNVIVDNIPLNRGTHFMTSYKSPFIASEMKIASIWIPGNPEYALRSVTPLFNLSNKMEKGKWQVR